MPDFGMPTLIETKIPADCTALAKELGLSFIELNMNLPQYQTENVSVSDIKALGKQYGLYFTIHLDENLNPCDFNPRVAEAYRQTAADAIRLARELGCPVLNLHLAKGVHFKLPEGKRFLYDVYKEQYLRDMKDFRILCEREIGASGIRMCAENCAGYENFQKEGLDVLLESPAFGQTLDVGHDFTDGGQDAPVIFRRPERLWHMHLHDAAGERCHLPLGTGEVDARKWLRSAEEHGCRVVLETKTVAGLRQSVRWLEQNALKAPVR